MWFLLMALTLVLARPKLDGPTDFERVKRETPEKYPQFPIKAAMTYILPDEVETNGEIVCPIGSDSNGHVCIANQEPEEFGEDWFLEIKIEMFDGVLFDSFDWLAMVGDRSLRFKEAQKLRKHFSLGFL